MTLATRIPAALKRQLRLYCAEHDLDVQRFVEDAIREAVARRHRDDA